MAEYSEKACHFLDGVDFETFLKNEEKIFAVVRALEVVGEAARRIPVTFRKNHPEIPWEDVAGMRSKLIHDYFGIDLEVVWRTVHEDLPPFCRQVRKIMETGQV